MTDKPRALSLADRLTLDDYYEFDASLHCPRAAAELRRLHAVNADLLEALKRAERKLSAYVGVCTGDKELTGAILPMAHAAISRAERASHD